MDGDKFELLFSVKRSIRYHDRRVAHFERLHQLSSLLTILLASSILLQIAGAKYEPPVWLTVLSFLAAVLAAIDIIIGYAKCAEKHLSLKRRFCELESCVAEANSTSELGKCLKRRAQIEQDEPPIYRALDILCHNEIVNAMDIADENPLRRVPLFKRITADFIRWDNIAALPNKDEVAPIDKEQRALAIRSEVRNIFRIFLTSCCYIGNVFLIYNAVTMPIWDRNAWPAQSDLELFIFLILIGIPVSLVSICQLISSKAEYKTRNFIFLTYWINLLIPIVLFGLLFSFRKLS